jgi:hypothetical protein
MSRFLYRLNRLLFFLEGGKDGLLHCSSPSLPHPDG